MISCSPTAYDGKTLSAICLPLQHLDFGVLNDDGTAMVHIKDHSSEPPRESSVDANCPSKNIMNVRGELKCFPELPRKTH